MRSVFPFRWRRPPISVLFGFATLACSSDVSLGGLLPDAAVEPTTVLEIDACGDGLHPTFDRPDGHCSCQAGETQPCAGPGPMIRVPGCYSGMQVCDSPSFFQFGLWGQCEPSSLVEACDGAADENCDGLIDEGCGCAAPAERACGFQSGVGPCREGIQRCLPGGIWSRECEGSVPFAPEACGDGIDNDCDGETDELCDCLSVPEVCGDGVDNDCDGTADEAQCQSPSEGVSCPNNPAESCSLSGGGLLGSLIFRAAGGTTSEGDWMAGSCGGAGANESAQVMMAPPGVYLFTTAGSSFDTVLYLRDGSCEGAEIACNDNVGGSVIAALTHAFREPTEVVVVVDGAAGECGRTMLTVLQIGTF